MFKMLAVGQITL